MLRSLLPRNLGKRLSELYKAEAVANQEGIQNAANKKSAFEASSKRVTARKKIIQPESSSNDPDYENVVPMAEPPEEAPKDK
jgi:hypothetical protein